MRVISLKSRVITLLVTFTIITIVLFVAVQLFHELSIINKFEATKASMITIVLRDTWDLANTWEKNLGTPLPIEKKLDYLKSRITSFRESGVIAQAYILDNEARIIFSTDPSLEGKKGDFDDLQTINKAKKGKSIEAESILNKAQKSLSLYVPLSDKDTVSFVVRLFFSLKDIWGAYAQVYQPAFMIGFLLIFINIVLSVFLSRLVIEPIKVFNDASKIIASGRLDLRVNLPTSDELEELASTFNFMTQELVKMKERAENANPLTKLPGNIVIREEAEKRIKKGEKFTVIYCDLDNFKAFNDKYGVHKGDEAIMLTAEVFKAAVKNKGNPQDFVGHEGGDDFLLLTTPERAKAIADYIIAEFDKRVRVLYSEEDLQKGCIVAHARDGTIKEFPIMTISLAGVTNAHRPITSYAQITNIAADVKKKAKKDPHSCFVLDIRTD